MATAKKKPMTSMQEARHLLLQIKPNLDMIPILAMLRATVEAQAIKERMKQEYLAGRRPATTKPKSHK